MENLPTEIIEKIFLYTDKDTCVKNEKIYLLRYFQDATIDWAAKNGYLEVIKYLHSIKKQCTKNAIDYAARNGHLEIVKYLHKEVGIKCTNTTMEWATYPGGHIDIVKYLHTVGGAKCTEFMLIMAIERGHLEIVKYLYENGIECTEIVMINATSFGHLEMVKYLHEIIGIECSTDVMYYAAIYGRTEVIEYFETNKIKINNRKIPHNLKT